MNLPFSVVDCSSNDSFSGTEPWQASNRAAALPGGAAFAKLRLTQEIRGEDMGKRDIRWREPKKAKKDGKKSSVAEVLPTSVTVEVIKTKGKKERPPEEE